MTAKRKKAHKRTSQERAPKCRLCHHRHWSYQDHKFPPTKKGDKP